MSNPGLQLVPSLTHAPRHDHDGHVVQLYTDDGFLIDVLSRFIGGALAVGDAAVVLATASHREELERRLSARGLDIAKASLQGRYVAVDAKETLTRLIVDGSVDETRFNDIIGGVLKRARTAIHSKDCRIAVFGELVALLWAEGRPQEAIRVEELWNDLAKTHSFSLLCAYPITGFNNERHIEPFLKMCGQHSGVVPSESYLGLSNEGERLRSIAELQQKAQVLEKELALRHSEERFRLLIEAVQDYAIFMLDTDGNISSWNLGAQRMKQYKPAEIIGKHFSCFYPEEDVRSGKPQWELVIAAKEGRFEDEGWRVRKDRSKFWANVIITALRDDAGKLVGFGKVTRDFTETRQAQQGLENEVAERRTAERRLQNSEKSLRALSLHLLRTQDEERRRIGRELHDSLGQYLAVLKIKLDSLAFATGQEQDAPTQDLAQCICLAEDCVKEVRTVSYLLYPPMLEEMGLQPAIPWYLDGFSARSGIRTAFELRGHVARLCRSAELALFRILQESLTNIHRHSGSRTADIRLITTADSVTLEVQDYGNGIPTQIFEESNPGRVHGTGVGLRGMYERMLQIGGRLELTSGKHGTTVRAIIPSANCSMKDTSAA